MLCSHRSSGYRRCPFWSVSMALIRRSVLSIKEWTIVLRSSAEAGTSITIAPCGHVSIHAPQRSQRDWSISAHPPTRRIASLGQRSVHRPQPTQRCFLMCTMRSAKGGPFICKWLPDDFPESGRPSGVELFAPIAEYGKRAASDKILHYGPLCSGFS